MIASSTLARPFGAASALLPFASVSTCLTGLHVRGPQREVARRRQGGLPLACRRGSTSQRVWGTLVPPYGRHDGMAMPPGRPHMPLNAAICLTGGFLNDSTSFDCPPRASSGRVHVAATATSRWRVAEAQHSKWVRGMSEPPYGRHCGMARHSGGRHAIQQPQSCQTTGSLNDPTSAAAVVVGLAVGVGEMGVVVASQVGSWVSCPVRGCLSRFMRLSLPFPGRRGPVDDSPTAFVNLSVSSLGS